MAAYIVFLRERLTDTAEFERYMAAVPPTMGGHVVKPLSIYGALETLEGDAFDGAVIAEFPTMDAARAWYRSPAYQEAAKIRRKAGDYRVLLLEGL